MSLTDVVWSKTKVIVHDSTFFYSLDGHIQKKDEPFVRANSNFSNSLGQMGMKVIQLFNYSDNLYTIIRRKFR